MYSPASSVSHPNWLTPTDLFWSVHSCLDCRPQLCTASASGENSLGILIWWWLRTVRVSTASVLLSNSSRPDRVLEPAAGREKKSWQTATHWRYLIFITVFMYEVTAVWVQLNSRLASKTLNFVKAGTLCSVQSCRGRQTSQVRL